RGDGQDNNHQLVEKGSSVDGEAKEEGSRVWHTEFMGLRRCIGRRKAADNGVRQRKRAINDVWWRNKATHNNNIGLRKVTANGIRRRKRATNDIWRRQRRLSLRLAKRVRQ
ncbi:hypothetical protein BHE74_00051052, partial [Ensete ventricosum]